MKINVKYSKTVSHLAKLPMLISSEAQVEPTLTAMMKCVIMLNNC